MHAKISRSEVSITTSREQQGRRSYHRRRFPSPTTSPPWSAITPIRGGHTCHFFRNDLECAMSVDAHAIEIIQPPGFATPRGYANGVAVRGRTLYVAGQVGWEHDGHFAS